MAETAVGENSIGLSGCTHTISRRGHSRTTKTKNYDFELDSDKRQEIERVYQAARVAVSE
jgi:hypothetical protein